ncbi:MAG: LysR family transcriptional regulator [Vitreoscilla sp.]|nr:LysR family transcriptional regulator [Vitreoscilla sp.]
MRKTGVSVSAKEIKGFDLNLLRVLVALHATRHVSRAAQQLGMSQSGFSTALNRLRQRLADPLFVRTVDGMAPTPRALQMIDTARSVLASVQTGILGQPVFDPASSRTEFRLAMADVGEVVVMPRLMPHLRALAPHACVSCFPVPSRELEAAMQAGEVDLAIGYFPDLDKQAFFHQRLYQHTFGCLIGHAHPLANRPLTERSFCELGHAVVSSPARSTVLFETFLAKRGLERRVALRTPHHMSLPFIIAETELIATLPLAAADRFARHGAVKLVRLPFAPPVFPVQQYWHRLHHHDVRSRWLRAQVAALFNDVTDEWRDLELALYGRLPGRKK